jgi:hypothetical protein
MTRGWVTSHFDVVDKLSPPSGRTRTRAYTHKLDFELDTAFHPFKRSARGPMAAGFEVELSLDYLATGLPKRGDVFPMDRACSTTPARGRCHSCS